MKIEALYQNSSMKTCRIHDYCLVSKIMLAGVYLNLAKQQEKQLFCLCHQWFGSERNCWGQLQLICPIKWVNAPPKKGNELACGWEVLTFVKKTTKLLTVYYDQYYPNVQLPSQSVDISEHTCITNCNQTAILL